VVAIELFGDFAVEVDGGAPIGLDRFERRTGAELVQVLALADDHRLHRDQVLDLLWPDAGIDQAKNAFYKAATYARRALHEEAIVVNHGMVTLFAGWKIDVDTATIEEATATDPASVDAALTRWKLPFLPNAPYADWALRARDRLRHQMFAVLTKAERWAELSELDPTNEQAAEALMAAAIEGGDAATALRIFRRLDASIREELGVGPSATALALRDQATAVTAAAGAAATSPDGPYRGASPGPPGARRRSGPKPAARSGRRCRPPQDRCSAEKTIKL
jgi:DNA-binding SARP family transcriptional activator